MDFDTITQFVPFVFFGIFAAIFIGGIYYNNEQNKKRLELLRELAPRLGLAFTDGVPRIKYAYHWELAGRFQGCQASIYMTPERENKRTIEYTHFDVSIPTRRAYNITISTEGIGDKIKKFFTKKDDISSGDANFDKAYFIESDAADQASIFLRDPDVREAIDEFFRMSLHSEIKNNTLMYSRNDLPMDEITYKSTLDQLVKIAKKLGDKESVF